MWCMWSFKDFEPLERKIHTSCCYLIKKGFKIIAQKTPRTKDGGFTQF